MPRSIRPLLGLVSLLFTAGVLVGSTNPVLAQRASSDSSRVRSARGASEGRSSSVERGESSRGRSTAGTSRESSARSSDNLESVDRSTSRSRTRTERASTRTERTTGRTSTERPSSRETTRTDTRTSRGSTRRRATDTRNEHVYRPAPRVRVDVRWPWEHRYNRGWSPMYRYRQVVHVDAGWGRHSRRSQLDVRTHYRHRVRSASRHRADVDVYIDRIEIFDNGHYVGEVRHIPADLGRVRATMYRDGAARFDRDLFIVGDPYVGFELISTRHYGGFILNDYRRSHGFHVGVLDLRRERVRPVRRSRLFDPYDFRGFVPISLLPQDEAWIGDYGYGAPTRHWYGDDDVYYYGRPDDYGSYNRIEPRTSTDGRSSSFSIPNVQPLERSDDETYRTESGAEIRLKRETTLERLE